MGGKVTTHVLVLLATALAAASDVPDRSVMPWEHCESTRECVNPRVDIVYIQCFVGDRRCIDLDHCLAAHKVDKNSHICRPIPYSLKGGNTPRWGGCATTLGCAPAPVGSSMIECFKEDKRCLSQADCQWANLIDNTSRDCVSVNLF